MYFGLRSDLLFDVYVLDDVCDIDDEDTDLVITCGLVMINWFAQLQFVQFIRIFTVGWWSGE